MAANNTLHAATCTTASDAFKNTLPQVRQFHRSLTAELDEKNARLRILVGGSYRQLLGTAEMILQMREDIGVVEDKLGIVGKGCGRGVIGGMARGLGKLQGKLNESKAAQEKGWLARMQVLGMCGVVVGKLLKQGSNRDADGGQDGRGKHLVIAAKVLVLGRLLSKSLSNSTAGGSKDEKDLVEESRRKLTSLKKRLSRAIDRTLEKTSGNGNREDLTQALCAYSLATSSGATAVLKHFLHVRDNAMKLAFEDVVDFKRETPGMLKALELYPRTLLDVQALVPQRLPKALAGLKIEALLKDEAMRQLDGLRLDVCEKWFEDEILFFTPYIRHDDLEGSQAVEMLKVWAKKASEVLLYGLVKTLQNVTEFKTVVELRTKILEVWIKDGGKAKGFDPSVVLDGLRNVVNERMVELLESRVSKLHLIASEIEATLGTWRKGITDKRQNLWDEEMLEMGIGNGAKAFKQDILARTYGRNDAVSRVIKGYRTWLHLVDDVIVVLDQLKKQRWDDDLEDMEDDLSLEFRNTLLSIEDPQRLQDHLHSSLEKSYADLHAKISGLLTTYKDSDHIGQISIYILRILRDIRITLPKNESLQTFGLSLVPSLHEKLAATISAKSVQVFTKSFNKKRVAGRALWEGNPQLPVQPSPATFKFLHGLALAMAAAGADLWSPKAVAVLKRRLGSELGREWHTALITQEKKDISNALEGKTNETTTKVDDDSAVGPEVDQNEMSNAEEAQSRNDLLIQSLFDIIVLQSSLELSSATEDELQALVVAVESQAELEISTSERVHTAAKEYWKRTSLLFGLLA